MTPNKNAPSAITPAKVMFAKKIKSVFDKLLPNQSKPGHTKKVIRKRFKIGEKFFFSACFKAKSPTERHVQWTDRLEIGYT